MSKQLQKWQAALEQAKPRFEAIIAQEDPATALVWVKEAGYAAKILKANTALQMCPPDSIRDAIVEVASVGLTLHPAEQLAYLVPRDGRATLNVSYKGLVRLAQISGAIEYVRANTVHEKDEFTFNGLDEKPEHRYNPFASVEDRGPIIGVYCYAKTNMGHYLADAMSVDEIEVVRKASKAPNSPAWTKWYGEMAKKAVIRRASKLWPRLAQERLAPALKVLNEQEGLDEQQLATPTEHYAAPQRKSAPAAEAAPTDDEQATIEGEFEEVEVEHIDAAPPPPDFDSPEGRVPLAAGARRVIASKLAAANVPETEMFKAFEASGWDDLAQADANSILEWIS